MTYHFCPLAHEMIIIMEGNKAKKTCCEEAEETWEGEVLTDACCKSIGCRFLKYKPNWWRDKKGQFYCFSFLPFSHDGNAGFLRYNLWYRSYSKQTNKYQCRWIYKIDAVRFLSSSYLIFYCNTAELAEVEMHLESSSIFNPAAYIELLILNYREKALFWSEATLALSLQKTFHLVLFKQP